MATYMLWSCIPTATPLLSKAASSTLPCTGTFNLAKLSTLQNEQSTVHRSSNISILENHSRGKVICAVGRGRGRMTFSRSETYVFLEPGKDEQFMTLEELKVILKGWLERWPEELEMPVDLIKFNNNLEDAVAHLVKVACELELGGGTGSLQWYEVHLE